MFTLSITDNIGPTLKAIVASLGKDLAARQVNAAVGRQAAQLTRDHLYALANHRHRGNVGQNFYGDAADSVSNQDLGDSVLIRIDKTGIAQRYHGGRIEPVNAKHLWIPIPGSPAEGRVPREFDFDELTIIISPLTGKGVAMRGDEVLFALVKSVQQDADPTVLPTDAEYTAAALGAIRDVAESALAKAKHAQPGRDERGRFIKRVSAT